MKIFQKGAKNKKFGPCVPTGDRIRAGIRQAQRSWYLEKRAMHFHGIKSNRRANLTCATPDVDGAVEHAAGYVDDPALRTRRYSLFYIIRQISIVVYPALSLQTKTTCHRRLTP